MAVLEELDVLRLIQQRVNNRSTHKAIAEELQRLFPGVYRGISARSVRRFCANYNLHGTSRLPNPALDVLIAYGIGMVRSYKHFFSQFNYPLKTRLVPLMEGRS